MTILTKNITDEPSARALATTDRQKPCLQKGFGKSSASIAESAYTALKTHALRASARFDTISPKIQFITNSLILF